MGGAWLYREVRISKQLLHSLTVSLTHLTRFDTEIHSHTRDKKGCPNPAPTESTQGILGFTEISQESPQPLILCESPDRTHL